jgi:hypothetical protein
MRFSAPIALRAAVSHLETQKASCIGTDLTRAAIFVTRTQARRPVSQAGVTEFAITAACSSSIFGTITV